MYIYMYIYIYNYMYACMYDGFTCDAQLSSPPWRTLDRTSWWISPLTATRWVSSKGIMVSYLNDVLAQVMEKSPLLSWKISTWMMVKTCVLYTSHKIHLLLKFIEIDEISVNLTHNYSKSDCHKLQKFQ